MNVTWKRYNRERFAKYEDDAPESAVSVLEVNDDHVVLDLPDSIHDCDRVIPDDAITFGDEAGAWFAWDLEEKQPRAPAHPEKGYAGKVKWGRDSVSCWDRTGRTFAEVLEALNGRVDGYCSDGWRWTKDHETGEVESPRQLYPMLIVPHKDFSPDPGLILLDFDDVVNVRDDGTGVMTREAWEIVQSLDAYTEVSSSMTGVHALVRGRIPEIVDGKQIVEDLDQGGHIEIRGYPGNGRAIGTTWAHIDGTPGHDVPVAQDEIEALAEDLVDDEGKLDAEEQAQRAFNERTGTDEVLGGSSGPKSKYYDLNVERVANTGPFAVHGWNGRGPHPEHGGTSTPDSESTNFVVSQADGWKCWAHGDGGGALQLIAVLEGIRDCGDAADVMSDPVDALRTCLAARDEYSGGRLDGESPPTAALKGVLEVQDVSYSDDGMLERSKYELARSLYLKMEYVR